MLGISACATPIEETRTLALTIGGSIYSINVPAMCTTRRLNAHTVIDCPRNGRPDRIMTFGPPRRPGWLGETKVRTMAIWPENRITYFTSRYETKRGLVERGLSGDLFLGGQRFDATCSVHGLANRAASDWCLPYLRTLRLK